MALTIIKCIDITGWQVRVTWYENFRAREELANSFNMTSKVYWFTKKILYQRADTLKDTRCGMVQLREKGLFRIFLKGVNSGLTYFC